MLPSNDEATSGFAPSVYRYNYQGNDSEFNRRYENNQWIKRQSDYVEALHKGLLMFQDLVPRFSWKQWSDDECGSSRYAFYMFTAILFSPSTADDKVRSLADQLFENGFDSPARVIMKQEDLWDFMDKSPETMKILALSGQHPNKIQFGVMYWKTKTRNYIRSCKKICLLSIAAKKFPAKTFDEQLNGLKILPTPVQVCRSYKMTQSTMKHSYPLCFMKGSICTFCTGSRRSELLWWQR
jgi:hypothetical protein